MYDNRPISQLTEDQIDSYSRPFQVSSRIRALVENTSKSIGASCNVYQVEDNIESIGAGMDWATSVLAYQGAPSLDLSLLRPIGSQLGSKGTSSGAVSFGRVYDTIISQMRREEKKNGAGILGLDYRHNELRAFLDEPYRSAYRMVYLPMHDTPEADFLLENEWAMEYLADAFNNFKTFLVKRPNPTLVDGEELLVNLCTEVEIPHKGFCILGAVNLSYFTQTNIYMLPNFFRQAMQKMVGYEQQARRAAMATKSLHCPSSNNKQVGLGIYGLSSMLGAMGISYEEFNQALVEAGVKQGVRIEHLRRNLEGMDAGKPVNRVVAALVLAYAEATEVANDACLRAAFCIQPTVSTAQRSLDRYGFNVSAEVQPVDGIKTSEGVHYLRKSAIKGDKIEVCHPGTWTIDEVPYSTYALTSSLLQLLMDSTGLAHRHSHCFYGEKFTVDDLRDFYVGELKHRKSLYYRLPYTNNNASLKKDKLWQDVADGELFDGDLDSILGVPQMFGDKGGIECAC